MNDKIVVACSECNKKYRVSTEKIGKSMKCTGCGESIVIEDPNAASDTVSAPVEDSPRAEVVPEVPNAPQPDAPAVVLRHNDFSDDFDITHPDEIMAKVQGSSLSLTLILSIVAHLLLLTGLSAGYIQDAIKYETIYPKAAIAEEAKAKRLAEKQAKAEEAEKKRAEAQAEAAKIAAESTEPVKKVDTTGKEGDKKLSKIEQELQETSDERPESSDLDSIDDDF